MTVSDLPDGTGGARGVAFEGGATQSDGGEYVVQSGRVEMRIDASKGGRITAFCLSGDQVLTGPDVVAAGDATLQNMYGSTFWTSPQAAWGWPPEPEIDCESYRVVQEHDVLSITSEAGSVTGYAVNKRFIAQQDKGRIVVEYTLLNRGASQRAAPWEISRVRKSGLVLFPSDSQPTSESTLRGEAIDGVIWLDLGAAPTGDSKLFQDGSEGWLAYVDAGKVLIKTFQSVPLEQQAAGEAEIEVFVSGDYDYVELEQQGAYAEQVAGQETTWTVGWWLKALPEGMSVEPGNVALVNWIRAVIAGGAQ